MGKTGTGKTHIGCAAVNFLQKLRSKYIIFNNLMRLLLNSFKTSEKSEYDILQKYICCDFLVLDEIGLTNDSEYTMRTLYTLVNERMLREKATLLITNFKYDEYKKYLYKHDERLYSRILAKSNFLFQFDWQDYRAKNISAHHRYRSP